MVLRQDFCRCRPRDSSTGYEVSALNLLARSSGIGDWQGFQKSFFPNKKIKKGRTHQEMHEECWKFVWKWVSPSWWRTPSSRWGHVPAWNSFTSTLQLGLGTQGDPEKSCWWMPKTCTNHNPSIVEICWDQVHLNPKCSSCSRFQLVKPCSRCSRISHLLALGFQIS